MRKRSKSPAPVFAALGDETRLRLVARISNEGPLSITALSADSKMTRQGITKHLRQLERVRLVRCTRRGRESVWQLDENRLEEARRYLIAISRQWDEALGRLRDFVEQ